MKTILITGINGFLGSHLAKALSADYNIIGLEYSLDYLFRIEGFGFKVYSSLDDKESIFIENQIFAVIHAATIYRRNDNESIESLINTNISLPVKLYELADKYGSEMFLNTDTFFNSPEYNYSYLPDYTLSKKQILEWLKLITKNCKLVNMKIFHIYGPTDAPNKFIPQMISAIILNNPSVDLSPGDQTRDFIYIDDVVSAFKTVLDSDSKISMGYHEYQIGTGKEEPIIALLSKVKEISKSNTKLCFGALPYRINEIMKSKANNKSLKALGWQPKFSLSEGLRRTIIGS